ncbi:MAG: cyclodeaminase/cyclohydrolase family protein [Ignavibacteriaceae bacterium]|nr:cyclodeaminase/cyclohydrolase family protein [Ignavibacteriaceae bacterium]
MNISNSIGNYLEELSSNSPTPGGGNVSAFCGALASSLGIMVCNLTIGKKKYLDSEEELKGIKKKLEKAKNDFLTLSTEDNQAFDRVMESFRLPKDTEEQKSVRSQKIEAATIAAGLVPYRVISLSKIIIPYLMIIAEKGNQNSLSDTGVAFSLISTAAQGAFFNVMINCSSYKDNQQAKKILLDAEMDFNEIKQFCMMGLEIIGKKLGQ